MEERLNKQIYNSLLDQIKTKDHFNDQLKNFLSSFSKMIKQEELLDMISKELDQKSIYFVRHAESKYNQWRTQSAFNWSIFYKNTLDHIDPQLTEKGVQQTKDLQNKLLNTEKTLKFDSVYVSPLSRAIDTYGNLAYQSKDNSLIDQFQNVKAFACHYLRERLDTSGDIGSNLEKVKNTLCPQWNINSDLVNHNQWWSHTSFDEENKNQMFKQKVEKEIWIQRRLIIILMLIVFSDEKVICLVSHSQIYKHLMLRGKLQSHGIDNAQMKMIEKEALMKFFNKVIPLVIYKK